MRKILIQANNLDTVIDTLMYICHHPRCPKQEIADYCGFTLRQVDYYTSACKYFDLVDDTLSPTKIAIDIFENHYTELRECVYSLIIKDEMIKQIYDKVISQPEENHSAYAIRLAQDYFPGYSEAVYKRRTDNMISWCKKISKTINQ